MRPKAVFFYTLLSIVFLVTLTAIGVFTGFLVPRSDSIQVLSAPGTAGSTSDEVGEQPVLEATPSATFTSAPLYLADTGLDANCTYTFLYWREHPESWLVDNILVGEAVYDKAQIQSYFSREGQDPQVLLHQQFFAAILNTIKGADSGQVETLLQAASIYIFAHFRDRDITTDENQQAINLALALQEYNHGNSGPGSCADQPENLILVAAPTEGAPTATSLVTGIQVNLVTPTPSVTPIPAVSTRQPTSRPLQPTDGATEIPAQPTGTAGNTPSATVSGTSTLSPVPPTAIGTLTPTPSSTPSSTVNPTPPATATIQPTSVPSPTPSATVQPTGTTSPTSTPRPSNTPPPTSTPPPTNTPEPTSTRRPTNSPQPSHTPQPTSTPPPTDTPDPTSTRRPTNTRRPTHTPRPSNTPFPPTTVSPSDTPLPPTDTPFPTNTPEPPTSTPEATDTPEPPPTSTPEPPTPLPSATETPAIIVIITIVVPILPTILT